MPYADQDINVPQPVLVPTASLHGKVAIVTGGSRGIGAGCALELARRGASVVVNYAHSKEAADAVVESILALPLNRRTQEKLTAAGSNGPVSNGSSESNSSTTGSHDPTGTDAQTNGATTPAITTKAPPAPAIAIRADVSSLPEITSLFESSLSYYGHIDIVMSNSGTESWDPTLSITPEKFEHVFNLNARAQFFVGQAAFRYLQPNGRLILMSSIAAGLLGVKDHSLYNASKSAVIGMVKSFATDFGSRGITVNGVAPGGVKSDMFSANAWHYIPGGTPGMKREEIEGLMATNCPLRRCAEAVDVARVVAFLASEDGGWINGQVLTISGGSSQ